MTDVHTIARQIQELEIYLKNLVSALTRGELPVNLQPVTQIFDTAITSLPPILDLSEDRFIDTYNDIPQILAAYAIDVTLSEDSYRGISANITFNRFYRGNYWIIATKDLVDKAWLVPNPLKNLSLDRLPSLYTSFDLSIVNKTNSSDFYTYFLVVPALVQMLPVVEPSTWKVLERGKITDSQIQKPTATITAIKDIYEKLGKNNYRQDRLAHDQDRLLDDLAKINSITEMQKKTITSLNLYLQSIEAKRNLDLDTRLDELEDIAQCRENRLVSRFNRQRDDIDHLQNTIPQILTSIEDINIIISANIRIEEQICLDYNNPKDFADKYKAKIANITKDSINANRGSEEKKIILEETHRGNYWIFNIGDDNYLVPVEDKYINQHSYTTTSTIFEGHNYTPDYQKIQLIKPAIVSINSNTNPQTWRLQQQGELVFL